MLNASFTIKNISAMFFWEGVFVYSRPSFSAILILLNTLPGAEGDKKMAFSLRCRDRYTVTAAPDSADYNVLRETFETLE